MNRPIDGAVRTESRRADRGRRHAIAGTSASVALWESLSPIARNEFICRIEDAKQAATRARRIERTVAELSEGKRRPCCWPGCAHRTDKPPGRWQKAVLIDGGAGRR